MAKHPLDETSAALLERIDKENARAPSTASSHLIGGIAAVGSKLDDFLRALLVDVARAAEREPQQFLPTVGKKTVSLRKATAGQLLRATQEAAKGLVLEAQVRACVEDARQSRSVLRAVVDLRNLAVHEMVLPADANAILKRLGALLHRCRREAGWDR